MTGPDSRLEERSWKWRVALAVSRSQGRYAGRPVSLTSMMGIVLGVTSLIIVLSITSGFEQAFESRILGFHPHLVVLEGPSRTFDSYREASQRILGLPEVEDVSPSTYNEMLIAGPGGRTGLSLKGMPLAGLKGLLKGGVEVEGELSWLDDSPTWLREATGIRGDSLVAGTSWTFLDLGEGSPLVVQDRATKTEPGSGRVRLLWNGEGEGIWVRAGDEHVWVPARGVSRGLDSFAAPIAMEWKVGDRMVSAECTVEAGERKLVVLEPAGKGLEFRESWGLEGRDGQQAAFRVVKRGGDGQPIPGEYTVVEGRLPGILLGKDLWDKLGLEPGQIVSVASPLRGLDDRMMGPFGMAPSSMAFRAAGWFKSGYYEYDTRLGVTDFRAAQRVLNRGDSVLWLDVRFREIRDLEAHREHVRQALDPYDLAAFVSNAARLWKEVGVLTKGLEEGRSGPRNVPSVLANSVSAATLSRTRDLSFGYSPRYKLVTWDEMNANLFGALKLQKVVLTVFFLIIIAVAAFNVVGSQIMLIHDKRSSIAILKAMGAPERGIMHVFLIQGLSVSILGSAAGIGLGTGLCLVIDWVGYPLNAEVYLINALPVALSPKLIVGVGLISVLLTTLTTLYSSSRAAKMPPVDGLRHLD